MLVATGRTNIVLNLITGLRIFFTCEEKQNYLLAISLESNLYLIFGSARHDTVGAGVEL